MKPKKKKFRRSDTKIETQEGSSEPFSQLFDIVNQKPVASFTFIQKENDPFTFVFQSNSTDDGIITKYIVKNGDDLVGEFTNPNFEITLSQETNNLSIVAVDEVGLESSPWITSINIERPVIDFDIIAVNPPYEYRLDFNVVSITGNDTISKYMIYTNNNVYETTGATFTLPVYSDSGTYTINVLGKTQLGIDSESVSKSITVTYPKIGEDIVPPDPGEEGNIGLVGIDVDQDGVRDDVEIILSDMFSNEDSPGRRVAVKYANRFQQISINSQQFGVNRANGEELINLSLRLKKCYLKNYEKIHAEFIYNKIIKTHFNTLDRFELFLKLRESANGMNLDEVEDELCEY